MRSQINEFEGPYFFLSNFYPEPLDFEGERFPSAEHAYQAAKTLDPEERALVREAATPDAAKRLATNLTVRADWPEIKVDVMAKILRAKFTGSPGLRDRLIDTGHAELVEGNWWGDEFWGVFRGRGQNHLGRLLMRLRAELAARPSPVGEDPLVDDDSVQP